MSFETGQSVYLRLHHSYTLPDLTNKKLSNQRVGLFKIVKRIGNLTYRLQLPPAMRIHPVVSVAQLESAKGDDPYHRPKPDHLGPVQMKSTTPDNNNGSTTTHNKLSGNIYEVEQVLAKQRQRYGKSVPQVEYQVKWIG